jgi:ubiquinone/menaquinone biosynthesis C-methylase UbiE
MGTGDGQTLAALVEPTGLVVGVDRRAVLLRPGSVNARASELPFSDAAFGTVLAADLFHHLDDPTLRSVLEEAERVLRPGGRLVAWWYETSTDPSPDAPRYPRRVEEVARLSQLATEPLDLVTEVPGSPTVGIVGIR